MIKNVNLKIGTFELNGQVIKTPSGVDIFQYIDSEVESINVVEVNADEEPGTEETQQHNFMA